MQINSKDILSFSCPSQQILIKETNIMTFIIILLAFSLLLQGSLGEFVCENLPVGMCSFAVASSGNRCLLETQSDETTAAAAALECKTSDVIAGNNLHEHIESDECLLACGLSRKSVGISSDNLLEPRFVGKLCSPRCRQNCHNILDLYSSLALGEGMYLPKLCKTMERSPRRVMAAANVRSSGAASATSILDFDEFAQSPETSSILDSELAQSPEASSILDSEFAQSPEASSILDSEFALSPEASSILDSELAQSPEASSILDSEFALSPEASSILDSEFAQSPQASSILDSEFAQSPDSDSVDILDFPHPAPAASP